MEVLPGIVKDFEACNIFSADETGLYWRAIPDGTLSFKKAEAARCKMPKEQVTLLLACNMDGSDKLESLAVGKSCSPCCFKNVKHLPVDYQASKNAWMTAAIWGEWLKKVDNKMRRETTNRDALQQLCSTQF